MSLESMSIDDIIEEINDLLDKSWGLPLSGGRSVVNSEKIRDLLQQITLSLPGEIRQAQNLVADRNKIMDDAKRSAKEITDRAEEQAKKLVSDAEQRAQELTSQDHITAEAQKYAKNLLDDTNTKAEGLRQSAMAFACSVLSETEHSYREALDKLSAARQKLVGTETKPDAQKPSKQ